MTAFAIEVSHHVRKQVMGIGMERPENLVLIVPREAAGKLAGKQGHQGRDGGSEPMQ